MKKERISIRFDERTIMLLKELCELTGASTSILVRGMVRRGIDDLTDERGNWVIGNAESKEGKGKQKGARDYI